MKWTNPETQLPEEGQNVLFKTQYMHTKNIRHAVYEDGAFTEVEVPRTTHDVSSVWGWQPFEDSPDRE
jgi:hypothetical protein